MENETRSAAYDFMHTRFLVQFWVVDVDYPATAMADLTSQKMLAFMVVC